MIQYQIWLVEFIVYNNLTQYQYVTWLVRVTWLVCVTWRFHLLQPSWLSFSLLSLLISDMTYMCDRTRLCDMTHQSCDMTQLSCDMTHLYVWHDSVWHESFICAHRVIYKCPALLACVIRLTNMRDMTRTWDMTCMCAITHTWDTSHLRVWHDW